MSRRRKQFVAGIGAIALLILVGWTIVPVWGAGDIDTSRISLVITADKEIYELGEQPKISATLTNNTGQSITIVPALDGSDMGRYPLVKFDVKVPSNALAEEQFGRCGNTNPLTASDFQTVAPGKSYDICGGWGAPSRTALNRGPGKYTIQLTYSTDAPNIDAWLGGPLSGWDKTAKSFRFGPQLRKLPRFTLTSNTLTIRYKDLPENLDELLRAGTVQQADLALRIIRQNPDAQYTADGLMEAVGRFCKNDVREGYTFVKDALATYRTIAKPEDSQTFWNSITSSIQKNWHAQYFGDTEITAELLAIVLRFPDDREERLKYLFLQSSHEDQSGTSTRRPIHITPEVIETLHDAPGDDVTRALIAMEADMDARKGSGVDHRAFEAISKEIASRREMKTTDLADIPEGGQPFHPAS